MSQKTNLFPSYRPYILVDEGRVAMKQVFLNFRRIFGVGILLLVWGANISRLHANPAGGTVTQGSATFNTSGSQLTINQTSANAVINWQSFNIGAGETTTFVQPSSTSVAWNQINDLNPSQILGNLNANGYVVLQNSSGFYVGGQASITAHGLILTTASTPALNLSSGGPWSFSAPPPLAKIINYGQINIAGGGSAFLIANDIENQGTISAPGGKIGLYAGQTVLVSTSPDGRGLSAQATIPQGLVDNEGNLIADAGSIALHAQMVNQDGLIQANSAREINGTIELVAGDSVSLGAHSTIAASGDSAVTTPSGGGSVTIQAGNSFSDQTGSAIDVSGGTQGGNGGQVEISAPRMGTIKSSINGVARDGFSGGILTIDPANIWLASADADPAAPSDYSIVNINLFSGLSVISLLADDNIALNTFWALGDQTVSASLSLSAGNNITLNDGSGIQAGQDWSVNLTAGTQATSKSQVTSGNGGIYLNGNAFIQAANGDINLYAANEVIVNSGAIRTVGGGNIDVTAEYGNVNSGINTLGYDYLTTAPYYRPDPNLGGISTAAGGDVTINAGGDVNSFSATTVAAGDPGTGAFDPTKPGSVTVTAGGNVYGHFVVANGTGTIDAGQDIGTALQNVSLSLINGGWNLNAPNGNIYLQEVRNPNGVFDNLTHLVNRKSAPTPGNHFFDYNQQASVALTAGNAVYLTGFDMPRPNDPVPMLLPPTVIINAGPGGVVLDTPSAIDPQGNGVTLSSDYGIILFPSPYQSLQITTRGGGWLSSGNAGGIDTTLLMSDSGLTQWYNAAVSGGTLPFGPQDHASVPALLNNEEPVMINLTGSQMVNGIPVLAGMENIFLETDKATQINIAGDMIGCSFYGENLQATGPASVTSITVGGQIYNAGSFTSVTLNQGFPALPSVDTPLANGLPPGTSLTSWYLALALAVDPNSTVFSKSYSGYNPSQLASFMAGARLFGGLNISSLAYNPDTKTLTAIGPMSPDLLAALQSPTLTMVRYGANGYPLLDANNHFVLDTINWVPGGSANAASISSLYTGSQGTVPLNGAAGAYVVGGTGEFDVTAGSISLGNSRGILSVGNAGTPNSQFLNHTYSYLTPYITSGANIYVKVNANPAIPDATGSLEMPSSTIASVGGGNVTVDCEGEIPNSPLNNNGVGVSMDLGSQDLLGFEAQIMTVNNLGLGIYAAGPGDVNVTALGTINIDSSRIASFDGGNVTVTSKTGDVNAGTGGASVVPIQYFAPNYFGNNPVEYVPANGIVAGTLTAARQIPVGAVQLPGNITVSTPQGSIYADLGGITQVAYDETLSAANDYTAINLTAGSDGYIGDIILGSSGVIGVNVNATATGTITGRIFSQGNANIAGQTIGNLLVVAGGNVKVSSQNGSTGPITIVAVGGVNANGIGPATLITSSVNGGAGTLATSSSATSASQSATAQTSTENQKQVASDASATNDDKKKKTDLVRTVGRVTVVLPKAS
jgi:filamentous hemagglutinin family protein